MVERKKERKKERETVTGSASDSQTRSGGVWNHPGMDTYIYLHLSLSFSLCVMHVAYSK